MDDYQTVFTTTLESVTKSMRGYGLDYDKAEELAQYSLVKLFEKQAEFRHQASYSTYAISIAKNKSIDSYRANKKFIGEVQDFDKIIFDVDTLVTDENIDKIHSIITGLPEVYYEVAYLYIILGLTPTQISNSLQLNKNTVAGRIRKIQQIIKSET